MNVEEAALKFLDLKKTASEALAQGDVEASLDAFSKEISLLKDLRLQLVVETTVIVQSEEARKVLHEIQSGAAEEEQAIAAILSGIEDDGTCGLLVENSADLDELASKLLYSWFSSRDYLFGLFRTGAIIVRCPVPLELRKFVE